MSKIKFTKLSEAPFRETPHKVDVREMYSLTDAQVMHITLQPGETLKPHKTPVDVFFYILEGTTTVHIGEEAVDFEKDTMVESPKNIVHYLSNNSDKQTRILVAKTPNPQTNRAL